MRMADPDSTVMSFTVLRVEPPRLFEHTYDGRRDDALGARARRRRVPARPHPDDVRPSSARSRTTTPSGMHHSLERLELALDGKPDRLVVASVGRASRSSTLQRVRGDRDHRTAAHAGSRSSSCASARLMIVLDTTIVNVALPSIREDLGFSETSLAWVVNAYLLTFGGFLLLGGRLGDLFGHRRLFLIGIALFTRRLARLRPRRPRRRRSIVRARGAGPRRRRGLGGRALADDDPVHRAGRAGEGDGRLRLRRRRRRRRSASCSAAILTDVLDWHWIFLVNIPIGDRRLRRSRCRLLPGGARRRPRARGSTSPARSP